jgi:cell division protease FtsH
MGHALVAKALPGGDEVHKVSIIPRGIGALGYTIQRPTEDRFLMTRPELERKMSVLLGGRAAETLIFEELSTGASDDLAKVTDIARAMVTRFGMAESLGQVTYEGEVQPFLGEIATAWRPRQYSEDTAREIDLAVRKLVDHSFEDAQAILAANRAMLERAARLLLARETLAEDDLQAFQPVLPEGHKAIRTRAS